MSTSKKELAVAALRNGTVIDHIPSSVLFKAVDLLGIARLNVSVTIGNNLDSKRLGHKGIIKVADTFFSDAELNRIALIAPSAVVNIIRDYEVVEKKPVSLPDEIVDIVVCDNPKCVSRNQPIASRFEVIDRENVALRCHYCEHELRGEAIVIK